MERLILQSNKKVDSVQVQVKRYLHEDIDWSQRLIIILGHRGAGKTTLMLQRMKDLEGKAMYLSLDDFYFEEKRLILFLEEMYQEGYRHFYLDEVHRYAHWSGDLKNIYDTYSDVHVVVTGSSILELSKGQADLSRRAAVYHLAGLSLREFILLEHGEALSKLSLTEILENHQAISSEISDKMDVLKMYNAYLQYGYYPFFNESKKLYKSRLRETTQLVLELDIAPFEELEYRTVRNMKKLLYIISQSVPLTPNISELASRLEVSRNSLLKMLDLLGQAKILSLLHTDSAAQSYLQKPEKIYLNNTNLAFTFSEDKPNLGNIRETFFNNQLQVVHQVTLPKYGDFMVDDTYVFEVGGPSKTAHQIKGVPNSYIVADGIKSGSGKKIPIWIFGFLY